MTTKTDAGGVTFIQPLEITQEIDGCSVTVTPLVMEELPDFIAMMVPIIAAIPGFGPGFFARLQSDALTDAEVLSMLTVIAVNGHAMIDMAIYCSRCHLVLNADPAIEPVRVDGNAHAEWVRKRLPDRVLWLAATCILVNADFFKKAMPQIRAMASQVKEQAGDVAGAASPARS